MAVKSKGAKKAKPKRAKTRARAVGAPVRRTKQGEVGLLGERLDPNVKTRREARVRSVKAAEQKEPMRRRILVALADGSRTPRELAKMLDSHPETMTRLLGDLRKSGLVEAKVDQGDRRRRPHVLTAEGEVALGEHYAYGEREEPSRRLDRKESIKLYRDALDRAIRLRRESNELEEAEDRLRAVVREACRIDAQDVALDGLAELTKTLRQRGDYDQMEATIDQLEAISLGKASGYDAAYVLPAAAHYRYAIGRCGERRGDPLPARAKHLATAFSLYGHLAETSSGKRSRSWLQSQAWSVLSLAGNLRKQTQLTRALHFAAVAKSAFDSIEDDYGRVQCLFMFGFCLRLLGEFKEAWTCLSQAHALASENAFARAQSETLMQMGEVCRCQSEVEKARDHLNEALELAAYMETRVTLGFARSALGAVAFQEQEFGTAREHLADAQQDFEECEHQQGRALNARRQAAVARKIALESNRPNYVAIERWIDGAIDQYRDMRSPAGLAACHVESGWVQMMRKDGRVKPVVEQLSRLLQDDQRRKTIELDPWTPLLLKNFAHEFAEAEFVQLADEVFEAGSERRTRDAARGLKWVSAVMDDFELEEEDESDSAVAEMGSETRRQLSETEQEFLLPQESSDEPDLTVTS